MPFNINFYSVARGWNVADLNGSFDQQKASDGITRQEAERTDLAFRILLKLDSE